MTCNARAILAAALALVLSTAVLTTATPIANPLLDLKTIGNSDEFYNANAHSDFLAELLLDDGLDFTIREACTAKAACDAQGRGDVVASSANRAAYASGNLAGKYGFLATVSVSNQNTIISETQSNNDKAGVTRVVMDPTLLTVQHNGKTLVVMTANAPVRHLACLALIDS
ncbi:hypothetical protein AMAG_09428 [Allomyces macrogynus ATCC 38327]|uniref:Uncharacterized protein n=1 Tax=Allomyces macrogynus (strain ATCC 38327) TaxID=578462 RepID=A0A0L0SPV3_ALLM3|nr:hypothetical protein AMAG_09428 [Allomyces macrogynus ATCC 38327]|eukprot:KNE64405.1 hypothetical protein AMAG_09428 [Allomyces macrogynus ATCC 38327]